MAVNREGQDLIENDISQKHLSSMERGKLEIGTGILLQINPEFVKKCWMAADGVRVSTNAVRHGFFSKFLPIQHPDVRESQGEYDDFYAEVRKHFQPVDFLEDLWIDKISVCSWRLRRLIRCESGQISRALAGHIYEIRQSKMSDVTELESESSSSPELNAITDHLFVPEKDELDKLLRYEAMINRQLNHAIAELERLQARRKGGPTAA